jgi:hypothetical protein
MIKYISYKHNNQGKRYAYLNLPNELVKGKEVDIIELDDKTVLLSFL